MLFNKGDLITITMYHGKQIECVKVLHHDRHTHWIKVEHLDAGEVWINLRYVAQIIEHEFEN